MGKTTDLTGPPDVEHPEGTIGGGTACPVHKEGLPVSNEVGLRNGRRTWIANRADGPAPSSRRRIWGPDLLGRGVPGKAVVVTTGTFLRGLMHVGSNQQSGGRSGEAAAMSLSGSLQEWESSSDV